MRQITTICIVVCKPFAPFLFSIMYRLLHSVHIFGPTDNELTSHTHTHNRKSFHINLCVIFLSHHFHIIISIYTFWPPFKMPYDRLKWVLCSVYKNGGHINVVAVVVHRMQTMAKCERFNISLKNHKTNYKLTLLLRWLVCFLNLVMCFAVSPCVCVCELWMWADNGPERECGNTRNVHHKRQR